MVSKFDMAKARREGLRWLVILTLNNARSVGAYEFLIQTVVQCEYPDVTALELRNELDYLDNRKLIDLTKEPSGKWHAKLNRCGIDVAEYTVDCQPGIARPAKYW